MAHSVYKYRKGEAYPHCYKYSQVALTADAVVFSYNNKQLYVLLIERAFEPFKGHWAFPVGFVNPDETAEQACIRELKEETSLTPRYLEQFQVSSTPERDPRQRVVTVPFIVIPETKEAQAADDALQAKWFSVADMPKLAFDHEHIFRSALDTLKRTLYFKPLAFEFLPPVFTLSELQRLYELILGHKFDRRNFLRKLNSVGVLDFVGVASEPSSPKFMDSQERSDVSSDSPSAIVDCSSSTERLRALRATSPNYRPSLYSFNKEAYIRMKNKGITEFEF